MPARESCISAIVASVYHSLVSEVIYLIFFFSGYLPGLVPVTVASLLLFEQRHKPFVAIDAL